ncbi:hypothetical protein GGI25_000454 [Coemansia spiralis]|uniref:Ras GEF n=1 Tax=Coemansia spiralis TaxID=417178 RepID=A0A9W8L156_9FUNG|nr:hypothetical protein GGI26_001721 [Coemansia sp. RSA 1358]KAJ2680818.1 hypothetical protein GGI25_000454 [Coemansia spiralis]
MTEQLGPLPFFVRALYPFQSEEASGLTFDRGDLIEVLACLESGWWNGVCGNNRGWFPSNYVEHVSIEQVQLMRQSSPQPSHLQLHQPKQQQLATPTTPNSASASRPSQQPSSADVGTIASMASSMDQSLLTAAANESIYRRGSIAVGDSQQQPGIASAVPSRLRMGRRGSSPFSSASGQESDPTVGPNVLEMRTQPDSSDIDASVVALRGLSIANNNSNSTEAIHVSQWESRVTLDGRTYFCNIFTDKTVWDISNDIAALQTGSSSKALELVGDEATLVYVSLMMSQPKNEADGSAASTTDSKSARRPAFNRNDFTLSDSPMLSGNSHNTSVWNQLSASIALAAFSLAASASAKAKHECLPLLSQVISGVKRLLLASAPAGATQDGPIYRTHRLLRDCHKDIMQHVCALVLSARVASTVWPPPDAVDAVHADVGGLIRSVRTFIIEAESAGIVAKQPAISDESVSLFPVIELDGGRIRAPSFSLSHPKNNSTTGGTNGKRLSLLQRNEHTGATVLVKGDSSERLPALSSNPGESLFAKDRTGIRQRLRQHLAEHHQRTNGKSIVAAPSSVLHDSATSAGIETDPNTAVEAAGFSAAADVLLQLEEGTHELARVILAFDRYMRKIERFYSEETLAGDAIAGVNGRIYAGALSNGIRPASRQSSATNMRSAADARLVAYAKHLVAALAVLLQILDDFDAYSAAVIASATNDDPASAHSGPASMVLASMDTMRSCRSQVNDNVGFLVAATQDFADLSYRYATASDSADHENGQEDPEIPNEDSFGSGPGSGAHAVSAERMLNALSVVADSLQSLNHSTMSLHISGKRVIEACDVCDLRGLWLRISKYHVSPHSLVSVPSGSASSSVSTGNRGAGNERLRRPGYRRSSSLPQLRRIPHISAGSSPAFSSYSKAGHVFSGLSRLRADTIDTPENVPVHLTRRFEKDGLADSSNSDYEDESPGRNQALREARAKDKLNRFFGDDPMQYSQSKRPPHMEDLSITPISSHQLGGSARTPTRTISGYGDEPVSAGGPGSIMNGAQSIMSSRSSTTPSAKALSNVTATSPGPQDQIPWYLCYDSSPDDMILTSDGQVKGSTLSALIERLVAHDVSDPNFVSTFLLTYHSFTTTPDLFEGLFKRFMIQPPQGLLEHELPDWTERKLKPVRLRVYNLFKTWLEQHYVEHVEGDPLGLEMLREFACTTMAEYMSNAAEQLVRLIDKRRASQGGLRKMVPNLPHAAPPPILPRSLSRLRLMDINPQELARQFTLIDSNLFNKVRPIECLKTAWSRKPGDPKAFNGLNTDIAVNVKAMSTLSTQTTLWVTANILLEHEIKRRAAVIKYFIAFAEHCRSLNNFNTLMSVLGALTSVPVERLTRTWQAVQQKALGTYNQLKQIMRTDRNFAEYRDSLHSCNPPAIPFVGVYLQDLTFIEDGNDDMIPNTDSRLINFAKRQRTAGTIRDLQQFQNVPYNLTPVAEIQDWLLKRLEELCPNGQSSERLVEEFWKMSTTLEPKEKDSERVLRLLKESGFL